MGPIFNWNLLKTDIQNFNWRYLSYYKQNKNFNSKLNEENVWQTKHKTWFNAQIERKLFKQN